MPCEAGMRCVGAGGALRLLFSLPAIPGAALRAPTLSVALLKALLYMLLAVLCDDNVYTRNY